MTEHDGLVGAATGRHVEPWRHAGGDILHLALEAKIHCAIRVANTQASQRIGDHAQPAHA